MFTLFDERWVCQFIKTAMKVLQFVKRSHCERLVTKSFELLPMNFIISLAAASVETFATDANIIIIENFAACTIFIHVVCILDENESQRVVL